MTATRRPVPTRVRPHLASYALVVVAAIGSVAYIDHRTEQVVALDRRARCEDRLADRTVLRSVIDIATAGEPESAEFREAALDLLALPDCDGGRPDPVTLPGGP